MAMNNHLRPFDELTDEEVLKEFVRRFECDGAILVYLDSNEEFGFGRWCNKKGKYWVKNLMEILKEKSIQIPFSDSPI